MVEKQAMIPGNALQKQCSILSLSLDYCPHVHHKDDISRAGLRPTSKILTFTSLLDIASEMSENQNKTRKYSLV